MLKKAAPSEKLISDRLDIGDGRGNNSVDGDGVSGDGVELAKKLGKLKGQKSAKFRKLSKSGKSKGEKSKKLSKSRNSPNSNVTEAGPSFLTPNAKTTFNCLWLAFIKAPILWHFDPECHIWIKTNASGYIIGGVLSQLTSGTSLDRVVTKADLGQWHPLAFFFRKMIPTKAQYKTHNSKLQAIVESIKI